MISSLIGEALTVVGRMTCKEAVSYEELYLSLYPKFAYTAEEYHQEAREDCQETGR